MRMSTLKSVSS